MKTFTRHILNNYDRAVFFSPHLDDAVFSAGGLLAALSQHMPITVINVFTNPGDAVSTLSAKQFLKQCAIPTPHTLYEVRRVEDGNSLRLVDAQVIDLEYTDALWRKKKHTLFPIRLAGKVMPEFVSLYPTYRYHVIKGRVHKEDTDLIIELARRFRNFAPDPTKIAVFAPAAFGNHVDHCIVRNAAKLAFGNEAYYWLDFPYFVHSGKNEFVREQKLVVHEVPVKSSAKKNLCEQYVSQYDIVITDKEILKTAEKFYHGT